MFTRWPSSEPELVPQMFTSLRLARIRVRALATAAPKFPLRDPLPASNSPVLPKLQFTNSVTQGSAQIPTYRVLDGVGIPIEGAELPDVRLPPPLDVPSTHGPT